MDGYLTKKGRTLRKLDVLAAIVSALLGAVAVDVSVQDYTGEDAVISILAYIIVTGLLLIPLFLVIRRWARQLVARKFARCFERQAGDTLPLSGLDSATGIRWAEKWLRILIDKGFLQNVIIDNVRGSVLLSGPAQRREPREAEDYGHILSRIRALNDAVADEDVSRRIDRIEAASSGILAAISQRPERANSARKIMNYYLPTAFRLLETYSLLEKQSYQGENIQASREKIGDAMDKLAGAMESQQDRLFQMDALDVEAELQTLKTMMAADGLPVK